MVKVGLKKAAPYGGARDNTHFEPCIAGKRECAVRTVADQFRVTRLSMERMCSTGFVPTDALWSLAARHSSFTYDRFGRRACGQTAFQTAYGHSYTVLVVLLSECVLEKIPDLDHRALRGGRRLHNGTRCGVPQYGSESPY